MFDCTTRKAQEILPINVERLPSHLGGLRRANRSDPSVSPDHSKFHSHFSPQPSDQSKHLSLVRLRKDSMTGGAFYVRGPTVRGRQVRSFGRFLLMPTYERWKPRSKELSNPVRSPPLPSSPIPCGTERERRAGPHSSSSVRWREAARVPPATSHSSPLSRFSTRRRGRWVAGESGFPEEAVSAGGEGIEAAVGRLRGQARAVSPSWPYMEIALYDEQSP